MPVLLFPTSVSRNKEREEGSCCSSKNKGGWSNGRDPVDVPRAGTLWFSSAESAQPIWAFHCFRPANVRSWNGVFVRDWQKHRTENNREVSWHWRVTLCLLSPFPTLLQRGVLPGDNHWHGSHHEHVHSRAVWRGRHGKWGEHSAQTGPTGVTPYQVLQPCLPDHNISPVCPVFHLWIVYIPVQIACKW